MSYTFSTLSPTDFENLSQDLLQRHLKVHLQGFAVGPDKGIDLRYCPDSTNTLIVQCKHYAKSGYARLKHVITEKELGKIKALSPTRYILATTVDLSPDNVDELYKILTPYCTSPHDIIGATQLNAILRDNPEVERTHFKLWLASSAVLDKVLHSAVFSNAYITHEDISRRIALYVKTRSLDDARKRLETDHVCIIAGAPGVGKTTLAELLLMEYVGNDWQLIPIMHSIEEAFALNSPDGSKGQVFYYDDFLGQTTSVEKLLKNEESALLRFMTHVERAPNKRLILTTREYILAQAKDHYEKLKLSSIDSLKYILECCKYTPLERARILANHLFACDVPADHVAAIVTRQLYKPIISHENYNPRLIEWMTSKGLATGGTPDEYCELFKATLDKPHDLWRHAFERQLSECARCVLLTLATCGNGVTTGDLLIAFEAVIQQEGAEAASLWQVNDFRRGLNEIDGTFATINRTGTVDLVRTTNPSVLDFISMYLTERPAKIPQLLGSSCFVEQVERLVLNIGGSLNWSDPSMSTILFSAIKRTLGASELKGLAWKNGVKQSSRGVWWLMRLAVQLGESCTDDDVRGSLEAILRCLSNSPELEYENWADACGAMAAVNKATWIEDESMEAICSPIAEAMIVHARDKYCSLDDLWAWVQLCEKYPAAAAGKPREFITDLVQGAVEEGVGELSVENGVQYLREAADTVQMLYDSVGVAATQMVERIEKLVEEAEEAAEIKRASEEEWEGVPQSQNEEKQIDALFRSLLVLQR